MASAPAETPGIGGHYGEITLKMSLFYVNNIRMKVWTKIVLCDQFEHYYNVVQITDIVRSIFMALS